MNDPNSIYRQVVAYVRPNKRTPVAEALRIAGVVGVSWSDVQGIGEAGGGRTTVPHVRIECIVKSELVETCTKAIAEAAHTGDPGDGVVAVFPIYGAFRIRTFQPL